MVSCTVLGPPMRVNGPGETNRVRKVLALASEPSDVQYALYPVMVNITSSTPGWINTGISHFPFWAHVVVPGTGNWANTDEAKRNTVRHKRVWRRRRKLFSIKSFSILR